MDYLLVRDTALSCVSFAKSKLILLRNDIDLLSIIPEKQPTLAESLASIVDEAWSIHRSTVTQLTDEVIDSLELELARASMLELVRWNGHCTPSAHRMAPLVVGNMVTSCVGFYFPGDSRKSCLTATGRHLQVLKRLAELPLVMLDEIEARIRQEWAIVQSNATSLSSNKRRMIGSAWRFSESDVELVRQAIKRHGAKLSPDNLKARSRIKMQRGLFHAVLRHLQESDEYQGHLRNKRRT